VRRCSTSPTKRTTCQQPANDVKIDGGRLHAILPRSSLHLYYLDAFDVVAATRSFGLAAPYPVLSVPQESIPQDSALQVDGSQTDAVATSSPAAAKPIEQSDAPSIPQQNDPQGSTLQVDGFKPTDAVATSSPAAAKPIEQSDAPSIPQQNGPQGSTLQVDGFKPTDTVATSSPAAAEPIEQSVAPSIPQQNDGSKPTDADVATSPATPTFRGAAAGADSAPSDVDAGALMPLSVLPDWSPEVPREPCTGFEYAYGTNGRSHPRS
jgi:hypothetical protein